MRRRNDTRTGHAAVHASDVRGSGDRANAPGGRVRRPNQCAIRHADSPAPGASMRQSRNLNLQTLVRIEFELLVCGVVSHWLAYKGNTVRDQLARNGRARAAQSERSSAVLKRGSSRHTAALSVAVRSLRPPIPPRSAWTQSWLTFWKSHSRLSSGHTCRVFSQREMQWNWGRHRREGANGDMSEGGREGNDTSFAWQIVWCVNVYARGMRGCIHPTPPCSRPPSQIDCSPGTRCTGPWAAHQRDSKHKGCHSSVAYTD